MNPDVPNYPDRDNSLTDEGYYKVPRTYAELFYDRLTMVGTIEAERVFSVFPDITCDHCARASICQWAFDPYNTNGDCLDEK